MLVDQVSYGRDLHAHAEEEVLFPAMLEAGMSEQVQDGHDEHQQAKERLLVLDHADPESRQVEQALLELIAGLRRHIGKEEREHLPELRRAVGADEMGRLGERFLAAKRSALRQPHPATPSSGARRRLAQTSAAVVDKVRDQASGRSNTLGTDASGLLDPQAQRVLDTFSSCNHCRTRSSRPSMPASSQLWPTQFRKFSGKTE